MTFLVYIVAGIGSMVLARRGYSTEALTLITSFCALVLGVTLYSITRDVDRDLAMLALTCRVVEAIPGHEGAVFFAVASTIFSWLLLRARMIPVGLAWLGVIASGLLVVILPLGGALKWSSSATWLVWLPMLVFEVTFAIWLMVKGVASPA